MYTFGYIFTVHRKSYKSQILICYDNVVPVKKKEKHLRASPMIISYVSKERKRKKNEIKD